MLLWARCMCRLLSNSPRAVSRPFCFSLAGIQTRRALSCSSSHSIAADITVELAKKDQSQGSFDHAGNIDPKSLRATLEAHRETNRASIIYKIGGKGGGRNRIHFLSPLKRAPDSSQPRGHLVRQLGLNQLGKKRRDRKRNLEPGATEYQGKSRTPGRQWVALANTPNAMKHPWLAFAPSFSYDAKEQLSNEIYAFHAYMSPQRKEQTAAAQALSDLVDSIQSAIPTVDAEVVGSQATGLANPFSDIDLNVVMGQSSSDLHGTMSPHEMAKSLLGHLNREMRTPQANIHKPARNPIRILAFIDHAVVPIITGVHVPTGLEFQIQSTYDCYVTMAYTKDWLAEYPTLGPLFMLLKQMLKMRGLCSGSVGGLTTYPLLGMIVAALKFSEGRIARDDIAAQLLHFFEMYSEIDFYTHGISLSPLKYVKKELRRPLLNSRHHLAPGEGFVSEELSGNQGGFARWIAPLNPSRPFLMSLQDPANEWNDLGRGVFQIKHVQATLVKLRHELLEAMKLWDEGALENSEKVRTPLLACLVRGDYSLFESERKELRRTVENGISPLPGVLSNA